MIRSLLLLSLVLLTVDTHADDFFGSVATTSRADTLEITESPIIYKAWMQQKTGYGYRDPAPGFSRNRADLTRVETQLYGQVTGRQDAWQWQVAGSLNHDWLADINDVGLWSGYDLTRAQQRERRWYWQMNDTYLAWQAGDWWIKGGYQTLAWGEAETLKVTDIIARRDQRWPGQEDLEQLRLPSPALLLTWRNRWELVALLPFDRDAGIDRQAAAYDEFDQLIGLRNPDTAQLDIHLQKQNQPGWALRWRRSSPGLDAQFIAADSHSFEPTLAGFPLAQPEPVTNEIQPSLTALVLKQDRQQVLGAAAQGTRGNWLLKTEQAWHSGINLQPVNPLIGWKDYSQWRAMLGLEYSGINDLTLSIESSGNYTPDWDENLVDKKWQAGQAVRLRYTLFNERLTLGGLAMRTSGNQGDLVRLTVDWQIEDDLTFSFTLVEYRASDDQRLYHYRHNNALLLNLRWGL